MGKYTTDKKYFLSNQLTKMKGFLNILFQFNTIKEYEKKKSEQ